MAKSSEYTKTVRAKLWLYRILDWLILFLPLVVYAVIAYASDSVTTFRKVALSACLVVALVLTLFNVIAQKRLRCTIWIILIGLYVAIQKWLLPLVIILAVVSILDDLLFTPLVAHYKAKLEASKVYDERKEEEEHANTEQQQV